MGRPRAGYWGSFFDADEERRWNRPSPMTQHIDLTGRGRPYRQVLNDEDSRVVTTALVSLLVVALIFTAGLWLSTLV